MINDLISAQQSQLLADKKGRVPRCLYHFIVFPPWEPQLICSSKGLGCFQGACDVLGAWDFKMCLIFFFFVFHECYRVKQCDYKILFFCNGIFQSSKVRILCIVTPLKEMSCNLGEEPGHLSECPSLFSFLKDSIQCVPLSGSHDRPGQPLRSGHFFPQHNSFSLFSCL